MQFFFYGNCQPFFLCLPLVQKHLLVYPSFSTAVFFLLHGSASAQNQSMSGQWGYPNPNPGFTPCLTDFDCSANSYCRLMAPNTYQMQCVRGARKGQACGGNVPPWEIVKCEKHLQCSFEQAFNPGDAGICLNKGGCHGSYTCNGTPLLFR